MAVFRVVNKTGKYHDDTALMNVITYCCNPIKIKSGLVGGHAVNPQYAIYEMEKVAKLCDKNRGLRLRHMYLSFDLTELQNSCGAYLIAYQAAMFYGLDYQIIFCVHEDTEHINVHFVMNSVSYRSGLKYQGTKKDYYDFQNHLRTILREYGIGLMVLKE